MDTSQSDGCISARTWNRGGWFDLEFRLSFQELGHKIIKPFEGTSKWSNFHPGWQVLVTFTAALEAVEEVFEKLKTISAYLPRRASSF